MLLTMALATMGAGLPQRDGLGVVYPGRKVMAICGDGGFMMIARRMETASDLKLDITCPDPA